MNIPSLFSLSAWRGWFSQKNAERRRLPVRKWAQKLESNLVIIDVGCRWGLADMWSSLGKRATIIGFDPDEQECTRLASQYGGPCDVHFVPEALGSAPGSRTLFTTLEPACSSIFRPDPVLVEMMPLMRPLQIVGEATIQLTTMDMATKTLGVETVDFIKLDVQGAELLVLEGAERCLMSARALEVEVEFNPIYQGQPLFGDIDRFLRARGFVLWRLTHLVHYGTVRSDSSAPYGDVQYFHSGPVRIGAKGGQLLWGHAYFVRREIASFQPPVNAQAALRDACLMTLLGFHDLGSFYRSHAA